MAQYYIVSKDSIDASADAIRSKTGSQAAIEWDGNEGFADAIDAIPTGGSPTGTKQISITQNGTTTEDVTNYASAEITVNVSGGASNEDTILDGSVSGAYTNSTVTHLRQYAFSANTNLTSVSFPNVTTIEQSAFYNCQNIESVSFPGLTTITAQYCFSGITKMKEVVFPALTGAIGNFCFNGDTILETADLWEASSLGGRAFTNTAISFLVLRGNYVCSLSSNTFSSSPFASDGTGGTLYVPSAYISSYQEATNWSTILGYANNQIKSIESTHTDPNAPVDLTLYYADGTLIPTS